MNNVLLQLQLLLTRNRRAVSLYNSVIYNSCFIVLLCFIVKRAMLSVLKLGTFFGTRFEAVCIFNNRIFVFIS